MLTQVVVRTSDIKGAGTDSNVALSIVGEKDGQVSDLAQALSFAWFLVQVGQET